MRTSTHRFTIPILLLVAALSGCAAERRKDSTTGASAISIERDVVYLTRGDQQLRADVYTPAGTGSFPGVLVVHGGSWQRGNKQRMAETSKRLAERGYVAVSIDYRLAPEHRFPAPLYDCQEALRWMRANAARLHLDPEHVGGFGYSAGAHLVAMLATTGDLDGLDEAAGAGERDIRLQAAVLGAAPVDLARFWPNPAMIRLLGAWPSDRPDVYAIASPINFVSADDPPMFLYHGASDWMVDPSQSKEMAAALEKVGVPTDYYETSGGHFATFLFDNGQTTRAIDFLDRWLKRAAAPAT